MEKVCNGDLFETAYVGLRRLMWVRQTGARQTRFQKRQFSDGKLSFLESCLTSPLFNGSILASSTYI